METNIAHLEPAKEKANEPLPLTPCSLLFRGEVGEWKKSALDAGGDGQNLQPVIAACCAKCWNAIERKEGEAGLSWVHRVAEWWGIHQANVQVDLPPKTDGDSTSDVIGG